MVYRIFIAATLLLLAACSEYIPIPGGKLEGIVTGAPADWSEIAKADIIQLESNPNAPYSVKLWIIGMGPFLYIHAGDKRTTWVENIDADPHVRILVDGKLYELEANRVTDAAEFRSFSDVYEEKYGNRPRNENVSEAYLFRLKALN